jgi:hypothetical protein
MNEKNLRKNLVELLQGGNAHLNLDEAIKNLNPGQRNIRPGKEVHSAWELLEHLRISLEDILRYTLDSGWKSPLWPEEYWPSKEKDISDDQWEGSIKKIKSDLNELIKLAENINIDLTSEFSHGEGRTYLRQILVAADHNSYHIGQIISTRKMLGAWEE